MNMNARSMDKARDIEFEIGFYERVLNQVPDYVEVVELLGCLYTEEGRIDDGLRMDELCVKLEPDNATAYYNLACSLCLKVRDKEALEMLRKAVSLGYSDVEWMIQDEDLVGLHGNREFEKIVAKLKSDNDVGC